MNNKFKPLTKAYLQIYNYNMTLDDDIRFDWDEEKNEENQRKHGVSFEEGQTVFQDPDAHVYFDEEHSKDE